MGPKANMPFYQDEKSSYYPNAYEVLEMGKKEMKSPLLDFLKEKSSTSGVLAIYIFHTGPRYQHSYGNSLEAFNKQWYASCWEAGYVLFIGETS